MSEMVYRNTRSWSAANGDTLFGGFARVLVHGCSGVVYREPARDRTTSKAMFARTKSDKPTANNGYPLWTPERIDTLPRTSGHLTRVGVGERGRQGVFIIMRCDGPSPKCWKEIRVLATTLSHPTRRPQSCQACCRLKRKQSFGGPVTPSGQQSARDYVAAQKEKAA